MSEMLARHFDRCPICSTLDEDGNERVCRTAKELAREAVQARQDAEQVRIREEIKAIIRRY